MLKKREGRAKESNSNRIKLFNEKRNKFIQLRVLCYNQLPHQLNSFAVKNECTNEVVVQQKQYKKKKHHT
uniref:Uncharacterized protein n=1 Tax=Glossina austeni TaxID=7395 RepID=A0A1A9UNB6_GLOAU